MDVVRIRSSFGCVLHKSRSGSPGSSLENPAIGDVSNMGAAITISDFVQVLEEWEGKEWSSDGIFSFGNMSPGHFARVSQYQERNCLQ